MVLEKDMDENIVNKTDQERLKKYYVVIILIWIIRNIKALIIIMEKRKII